MTSDRPVSMGARAKAAGDDARVCGHQRESTASAPRDKRDRIIEVAIMVFHEYGYERTRIADITDSLAIGKGTLYLYFQSKKDLLLACLGYSDRMIGDLEERLEVRGGDFFSNLLERMQRADQFSWFSPLIELARTSEHSPDPEVRERARLSSRFGLTRMERDLVKEIRDGRIRDIDPELALWACMGMSDCVRRRVMMDERYSVSEGQAFIVEAIRTWLSLGPSNAVPDTAPCGDD